MNRTGYLQQLRVRGELIGRLGVLLAVIGMSMQPWMTRVVACGGSPPPQCGRTVRMAKNFPTTIVLQPGAGVSAVLPIDVTVFQTSVCTGLPTSGSVTLNFTNCTSLLPPFGPVAGGSVTVPFIPVLGNQTVLVPVTLTAGPPRQCTVSGSVSVTWSGGQTLTNTGDTMICLVEPSDQDPDLPRLDLTTVGPSVVRVHPGDQGRHTLRLTNNDQDESVTVTLAATSTQASRMPTTSGGGVEVVAFDNGAIDPLLNAPSSQSDVDFPFEAAAADDFSLPQDAAITGVRFSGINFGDTVTFGAAGFDGLKITFYEDAGGEPAGSPGPDGEGSHLGGITYQLAPGEFSSVQTPGLGFIDVHDFTANLPTPFIARAGVTYWIEIQAVMSFDANGQWGLGSVGPFAFGQPAQAGFPLIGIPFWSDAPKGVDLAFQLITVMGSSNQDGPFALADPGVGDNFPIEWGPICESVGSACLPLPANPMDYLPPTVEKTVTLGPGESEDLELFSRGWGMCADGSCSEIIIHASGSFSGGDPATACVGVSTVLDIAVPSTYECGDACITALVEPEEANRVVLISEPYPKYQALVATELLELQLGGPECPAIPLGQTSESLLPSMGRLGAMVDAGAPTCAGSMVTTEAIVSVRPWMPNCIDPSVCVEIEQLQLMPAPPSLANDYFTVMATAVVSGGGTGPDVKWTITYTIDLADPPTIWGPGSECFYEPEPKIQINLDSVQLIPISNAAFMIRFDSLLDFAPGELVGPVGFNLDVRACAGDPAPPADGCCATPFDSDSDGDVDLVDFGQFQLCFTGPGGGPVSAACICHDGDGDLDVDLVDFGAFQLAFTGPL